MTVTIESSAPVFKTCGINIPLGGQNLPDSASIFHPLPKKNADHEKLRTDMRKCEVVVTVGEKRLNMHKDILCARIPFFRALFHSEMTECNSGEINISAKLCEFDTATIEKLLDYAYTGQLEISEKNVQNLMMGAIYLQIESVVHECAQFLRRRLNLDIPMLQFCRSIKYNKIDDFILRYLDKNFVPLSDTADFLEVSIEHLELILKRDSLYVDSEEQASQICKFNNVSIWFEVLSAVKRWINADVKRGQYALRLIQCVRFTRLSESIIDKTIERTNWAMENSDCLALLDKAKELITSKEKRNEMTSFKTEERVCEEAHRLIFAIGQSSLQLYDPIANVWSKCENNMKTNIYSIATAIEDKIYSLALSEHSDQCNVYNTISNQWDTIPNTPRNRILATTAVINGKIYIVGGSDMTMLSSLASIEMFDPSTQEWSKLTPMKKQRSSPASCVLNGKLYVIGGRAGARAFDDGERYDPDTDSWTPIGAMKHRRCAFAAASFNGHIYVAGGYDESTTTILNEVERYDPVSDTWTCLKKNCKRAYASLVVSCGKLFVLGGFQSVEPPHKLAKLLSSLEMYHPETDSWETRKGMDEVSLQIGTLPIPALFPSPVAHLEGNFDCFHLKGELVQAIKDLDFLHPYQTQQDCISRVLIGEHLICQSLSGTGKTTLSVISILQLLDPIYGEIFALVLCSTREMAVKVGEEFAKFAKYFSGIRVKVLSEDVRNSKKQRRAKSDSVPHILVGTPALVHSQVKSGAIKVDKVKLLVIDHCDRIVGDYKQRCKIDDIVKSMPKKAQIMMFNSSIWAQI